MHGAEPTLGKEQTLDHKVGKASVVLQLGRLFQIVATKKANYGHPHMKEATARD